MHCAGRPHWEGAILSLPQNEPLPLPLFPVQKRNEEKAKKIHRALFLYSPVFFSSTDCSVSPKANHGLVGLILLEGRAEKRGKISAICPKLRRQ